MMLILLKTNIEICLRVLDYILKLRTQEVTDSGFKRIRLGRGLGVDGKAIFLGQKRP